MSDAKSPKTVEGAFEFQKRCVRWGEGIGAAIPVVGAFFIVLADGGHGLNIAGVIGGALGAAILFAGFAGEAGNVLAWLIEPRLWEASPSNHPLHIPADVEATMRERFTVAGDVGPQEGVKREGEVRGA